MRMSAIRAKRITTEYQILKKMYKEGIMTQLKSFPGTKKSIDHLAITLKGPKGTPYEGGLFRFEIKFPPTYPYDPPFMRIHTPIWHPNFWPKPHEYPGKRNICLALLDREHKGQKDGWSPSKRIDTVIHAILAMLDVDSRRYVNPTDVFNKKAAIEMLNDFKKFKEKARAATKKYANKKW